MSNLPENREPSIEELEVYRHQLEETELEITRLQTELAAAKSRKLELVERVRVTGKRYKDSQVKQTIWTGLLQEIDGLSGRQINGLFDNWNPMKVQAVLALMIESGEVLGVPGRKGAILHFASHILLGRYILRTLRQIYESEEFCGLDELVHGVVMRIADVRNTGGRGFDRWDQRSVTRLILDLEQKGALRTGSNSDGREGYLPL
jgi:hypothetical protein